MNGRTSSHNWYLRMQSKFLNINLNTLLMGILMLCAATLCNENRKLLYLGITILIAIIVATKVVMKIKLLSKLVNSKFFIWVTTFISFIMIDAFLRTQYSQMNFDLIVFIWGTIGIFFLLLFEFNDPSELIYAFSKACMIAAIGFVICIVIMEKDTILSGNVRIGATMSGNNANITGVYLGIYSLGMLFMYIKTHKKILLLSYLTVVIFMLLTGSKKVFFPIILGIAMFEICGGVKAKKILLLFAAILALILLVLYNSYFYNIIGVRVLAFLESIGMLGDTSVVSDGSTSLRKQLLTTAWQLFADKPILGWGYFATARFSEAHLYSHNNYAEILANYGIVGFFLYYGMIFRLLWKSLKLPRRDNNKYLVIALLLNSLLYDVAAVNYTGLDAYIPLMVASVYLQKERLRIRQIARRSMVLK